MRAIPSGDLIVETRAWRDRLFDSRAPQPVGVSGFQLRMASVYNFMFPGGMGGMGGGMALNQLLVVMDGIDNPPLMRRFSTSKLNTLLDATFIVPRSIGKVKLRLPAARPRNDQIYFIGATNVPIDRLDPALIRPGPDGPARLVPDAEQAGSPRHPRPLHRQGRRTTPSSTRRRGATRSRGS